MTEERKKKIKSEIIVWLLSIISIALLAFVISMRRAYINPVLAYHEDTNTGNLVSDNIMDWSTVHIDNQNFSNQVTITQYGMYGTSEVTNGIARVYTQSRFEAGHTYTLTYWGTARGIWIENGAFYTTTNSITFTTPNNSSINFNIDMVNNEETRIDSIMVVEGSTTPTTFEPYGKIYYYSPRSYNNKNNQYENLIRNINYLRYSGAEYPNTNVTNKDEFRITDAGYLAFNNTYNNRPNNTELKDIIINTESMLTTESNLSIVFDFINNLQMTSRLENSFVAIECINYVDIDKYDYSQTISTCPIVNGGYNNRDNLTVNLYTLFQYDSNGNIINYFKNNGYTGIDTAQVKFNRIHFSFSEVNEDSGIPDSGSYVGSVIRGIRLQNNYDESYIAGYKSGVETTKNQLDDSAYQRGYVNGKAEGYTQGFNEGSDENRNNTIVGLADTILTAPFDMFNMMFDFNFLGVNIRYFLLSIITAVVAVWIIKKFW